MSPSRSLLALAVLGALACRAAAQQPIQPAADTARPLKEVSVSATRTERAVDEVPATVTVIPAAEIQRQMARDIKDLIRYEPGVEVPTNQSNLSFAANPQRSGNVGFSIRGVEGNRVQVVVDGVRMPSTYSIGSFAGTTRDLMDLDLLSRVEILRGPSSTLYGSDALGGVVSFTTQDPQDVIGASSGTGGRFRLGYASVDRSWLRTLVGAHTLQNLSLMVAYSGRSGGETDNMGTRGSANRNDYLQRTQPNPESYKNEGLLAKAIVRIDAAQSLRFTFDRREQGTSIHALNVYGQALQGAAPAAFFSDARGSDTFERTRLSAEYRYANPQGRFVQDARVTLYRQDFNTRQVTENQYTTTATGAFNRFRHYEFQYAADTRGAQAQLESRANWGGIPHRILWGGEWSETATEALRDGYQVQGGVLTKNFGTDRYPTRDFPNSTTTQASLFVQDEMQIGALTLIPGLRHDRSRLVPDVDATFAKDHASTASVSQSFAATTPKLGALWQLTDVHSLWGQVARGFRAPPVNDVNLAFVNNLQPNPANYTSIPNPNLKPEKSTGYEFGLRGNLTQGSYGLTWFDNRYRDFIDSQFALTCPGTPGCVAGFGTTFQSVNHARVRIYGLEAKGDWRIGRDWTLRGSYAWAHGDDQSNGRPLNTVVPAKVVAGLQWKDRDAPLGAEAIVTGVAKKSRVDTAAYVSGTPATAYPAFVPGAYSLVDVLAWWRPAKGVTVNAGLFNAFDKKYWQWSNVRLLNATAQNLDLFTSPGRNASLSVKLDF